MSLLFLCFEPQAEDDGSHTWEAMASVTPDRWAALWNETHALLLQVQQALPCGPGTLDDGADWDALLQLQTDNDPPLSVAWSLSMTAPPTLPEWSADTRWIALTLTVATSAAAYPTVAALLQLD